MPKLTAKMWPALGSTALLLLSLGVYASLPDESQPPNSEIVVVVQTPAPLFTPTPSPSSTPTTAPTRTPSATSTATRQPTPTSTPVVGPQVFANVTRQAVAAATRTTQNEQAAAERLSQLAAPPPRAAAPITHQPDEPLVLAHYFAWFDGDGWDDCNISAGDKPLQPYHSDDPAAIGRHVLTAQGIGLDGFLLHWFAPNGRTDNNFATLLRQSEGSRFTSSVVYSRHIWHGSPAPNNQNIAETLRYITEIHGVHPNFLRLAGKPVIFFTDVYRTPAPGQTPQQFWAAMRQTVDPQQQAVWIAEGLDTSYLQVFDGLYVFKISHAGYPHDYQKSPRWGRQVRRWAANSGQEKLWLATISPGWDDLRSGCKPDVRVGNTRHRLDRADGAVFEATFAAAMESDPDWLLLGSFNEWVEGTYVEPSVTYGDKYLQMTADFIRRFKGEQ